MRRDGARQVIRQVERLASEGLDWVRFATQVGDALRGVVPYARTCWHPVDPGTYLFTGSVGHNMVCSGAWLAEHEYVIDDVNKWHDLARSECPAASLDAATGGDLICSARVRSSADYGMPVGDELRVAFVRMGTYWGAAGFIRDPGTAPFDADEVALLASLSPIIADGFRRALLAPVEGGEPARFEDLAGVIVLDARGDAESISPAAAQLLAELDETPPVTDPRESRTLQAVAARARRLRSEPAAGVPPPRARVRTRNGRWLQLYATPLSGEREANIAVVIQPAGSHDIAPLVARAYGLSDRERQITRLCLEGQPTREIACALGITEYTVQDHLKSIFRKTGTRTRGELVALVFLEHFVTRFEDTADVGGGWSGQTIDKL